MSAGQCRAARGYLGWSREELAKAAGVSRAMVADFEGGKRDTLSVMRNALQDALEAAGVVFPERTGKKASIEFAEDGQDEDQAPASGK
jgi:transcriptional regulator with XRE-family HTH domain